MEPEFDHYSDDYERLVTDSIRSGFGGGTSEFFHKRKMQLLLRYFKRKGQDVSAMSWLDVGCGRGDLLELGRPHFRKCVGCDPSIGMLSATGDTIEVRQQKSSTTVPYEPESFDLVTAVCVYHHVIPQDRTALTNDIARVLKPGGLFVMIEHNPLNPVTRLAVSRIPLDRDAQLLTARSARSISSQAGLRPLKTEYFLFLPKALYEKLGTLENGLISLPVGGQYATYASKG